MFLTKKHIPRRTFLRGAGVTLALPLLESMVPALTPLRLTAASPVKPQPILDGGPGRGRMSPATDGGNDGPEQ